MPDRGGARIDASVVITTRNRSEDTLVAVASCLAQQGIALEVLVYDDASDDSTAESVGREFPQVRIFTSERRTGYIVNRNRGFHDARGRYVFSIDDDAYFSAPDIVADVIAQMEADATIGAIAIPYVEPLSRLTQSYLSDPFAATPGDELRNYIGCAHAVRRDVALSLGGYRDFFIHQGEERDFCLRLWAAGYRVVYGGCGVIVHMVSPKRDTSRMTHYGVRNQIVSEFLNAPMGDLLMRVPTLVLNAIRYRFDWHTLPLKLRAIASGVRIGLKRWSERKPVPADVYLKFRQLPPHGPQKGTADIPMPATASRQRDVDVRQTGLG